MNFNLSRNVHYYYMFSLLALGGALCFGLYHFWHKGPANIENISSVFEATLQIDEMKKREDLSKIRTLVINDRVREAVRLLETIDSDMTSLNRIREVEAHSYVQKDIEQVKQNLNKLIAFPELSTVMLVFSNKLNNFENFVTTNNWSTLSRTAKRIQTRVTPERLRSTNFYSYDRLAELTRSFEADFELMKNVTTGSVLSQENKNSILTNLQSFNTELEMLKNYTSQMRVFKQHLEAFETSYQSWFSQIEPAISYRRIEFEKNSQNILFAFIGIIGITFLLLAGGFFVYTANQKGTRRFVERLTISTIRDGLIPLNSQMPYKISKEFETDLVKYREYIHKRMSFGSIFQEAMPFSSILLDSNLNVVWANTLFYQHWSLQQNQVEDGSTTWDYLQQFTNLGEDDPVIQALKQDLAGIYHIQVKRSQDQEAQPFEMYVSPVEYAGQKRIMIIFYPLTSLEQTLSDQTRSLIGPVSRALDTLESNQWTEDFAAKIEKDFVIAGISQIHEKFKNYHAYNARQKEVLSDEIKRISQQLMKSNTEMSKIKNDLHEARSLQKRVVEEFNLVKEDVIRVIDLRGQLESYYQSTSTVSKTLLKEEVELLKQAKSVNQLLTENISAFDTVCRVRDDFKTFKNQIDQYRTMLMQLVDQSLVFGRTEAGNSRVDESLNQIKVEMRNFDKLLVSFSKVSTQLDVGLSKVSMILNDNKAPDLSDLEYRFNSSREAIENDMYDAARLVRETEKSDEQMINSLRSMHATFVSSSKKIKKIELDLH